LWLEFAYFAHEAGMHVTYHIRPAHEAGMHVTYHTGSGGARNQLKEGPVAIVIAWLA
jgi:hypothetical protein